MPNQQPDPPAVERVLNAISDWVSRYRDATARTNDLGQCSPDEVMQIANEMGVSIAELGGLVNKGPHAADLVQKMLIALDVNPLVIAKTNPLEMRDLQKICINCSDKKRCRRELEKGTAAAHFSEFCPSALTLNVLFNQKHRPSQ